MNYISVCSGIEAATAAWHPLGWEPLWFSEIEPFPSAVLQHHYPGILNMGDMTKFKEWPDAVINVLVGGTPCQSFSVAGLRKGLDDPRGNLMLTYLAIAKRYRPQWVVWENVPGVLSSNGGRDFATFFRGLEECGYGVAYRILDAQYFGVAQRRRRVFVVGCLGSWQRAAAVLFERDSLCGNPAPSREKRQDVAGTIAKCSFSGGAGGRPEGAAGNHFLAIGVDEECNASIEHFGPLLRGGQGGTRQAVAYHSSGAGYWQEGPGTLRAREQDSHENVLCMSTGQASAEIGTGIGTTLNCNHEAPIVVHGTQDPCTSDIAFAQGRNNGGENVVCFGGDVARTLSARHDSSPCADRGMDVVATQMRVRRLTPVECERLQGFPDGYTNIPWRNKSESPDGPRYKALGNSMAVPVMKWIGKRIQEVDKIK